jgi:hypothetical protein
MTIARSTPEAASIAGLQRYREKLQRCPNASLSPAQGQAMKTVVIAFCLLCATAAFGQVASSLSNNPQPLVMTDHPQRAETHPMAPDDNLRGSAAYTFAQGERPLWEFPSEKHETPLGDIARAYRKDHAFDKKATIVVEK